MRRRFWWVVLAVALLAACTSVPVPVVEPPAKPSADAVRAVEAAVGGQGFGFDLAAWIRPIERQALTDFLADVPGPDRPVMRGGVAWPMPPGEVRGWKGPANTNGYGLALWVLKAGKRYKNPAALAWVRENVLRNVFNYWIYFAVKGRGPNEGVGYRWESAAPDWITQASALSGIPVDTLVWRGPDGRLLVPEADAWDGSSYERHHCYDFVAVAAGDPAVPLSDAERELCCAMLEHYAASRLENARLPVVTQRHEWGHYPVRTYVAIYRLFKGLYKAAPATDAVAVRRWDVAQRCLQAAEGIVWYGWHPAGPGRPSPVVGRGGDVYWAWDQGTPADPGWHQLNQIDTERPWYVGLRASAWAYLYTEPDCSPWVRNLIAWVICEEAKWCVRDWKSLPALTLRYAPDNAPKTHDGANGWLQGGTLPGPVGDRWIRADSAVLAPDAWAALPPDLPYHPLTCLKARESDNGYFARWWPEPNDATGFERWHYPKIRVSHDPWPAAFGPRLDINGGASWAGMPDVLVLAGALKGDPELVKTGIWMIHDYLAFSNLNHSGNTLLRSKADGTRRWYGGLHTTRSFYWLALACGEWGRSLSFSGSLLQFRAK